MFIPFNTISKDARIWIYQSDRKFSEQEKAIISEELKLFTNDWAAHGQPLNASFDVRYDHFILLAVDESFAGASGCSIDTSVRVIKKIEETTGANLFDRNKVAFYLNGEVTLIEIKDLKEAFANGVCNDESLVFNNVLNSRDDIDKRWIVPARETWLKRFIPIAKINA